MKTTRKSVTEMSIETIFAAAKNDIRFGNDELVSRFVDAMTEHGGASWGTVIEILKEEQGWKHQVTRLAIQRAIETGWAEREDRGDVMLTE